MLFGNVLFVGGAFTMAFSPNSMLVIMVGRVIVGLAMGTIGFDMTNVKGWLH